MSILEFVSAALAGGLVSLLVKVTVILLVAAGAALALSRASAAVRHLVWGVALGACTAVAFAAPFAPRIAVPVSYTRIVPRAALARPSATPAVVSRATQIRPTAPLDEPALMRSGSPSLARQVARPSRASVAFAWIAAHGAALVGAIWLLGCLSVLARCAFGHVVVARLVERSRAANAALWGPTVTAALVELDVGPEIDLLVNDEISGPVTSGWINPVILLPADAEGWTYERRWIVLVHEVAHVARADYLAQLVGTIACALFWFHPLVWLAAARLRAEAEHAADDRVLGSGTVGVTYATHLLDMARGDLAPRLSAAVAVGMVESSRLEGRFRAMLDTSRSRAAVPRRVRIVAAALAACMMIPVAGIRTVVNAAPQARAATTPTPAIAGAGNPQASLVGATFATPAVAATTAVLPVIADSTIEKTIDAKAGGTLHLDLATGGSVVLHGWSEPRVRMRVRLGGNDWQDARVTLNPAGDDIRLRSDFSHGGSHSTELSFELWLPRQMDVQLSSAGGSFAIDGVNGRFSGHTGGGAITIAGATGHVALSTGGGELWVTDSNLGGELTTGWGKVTETNVSGGLKAWSSGEAVTNLNTTTRYEYVPDYHFSYDYVGPGSVTINGVPSSTGIGRGFGATIASGVSDGITPGLSTGISAGVGRGVGWGAGVCGAAVTTVGHGTSVGFGYASSYSSSSSSSSSPTTATMSSTNTEPGFSYSNARTAPPGVAVAGSASDAISIFKSGGNIDIDDAPNGATLSTGGGHVFVGSSSRTVVASTGGGDIDLGHVTGDATASTGSGDVTISVVNDDRNEHSITVCNGSGRVIIDLPADIDATLQLETAYTDNYGRRTTIDSDFHVDQTVANDWDDGRGTPRKYVRGSGVVGNGRGLIRVQTVNGDIVIRRR